VLTGRPGARGAGRNEPFGRGTLRSGLWCDTCPGKPCKPAWDGATHAYAKLLISLEPSIPPLGTMIFKDLHQTALKAAYRLATN
jgi:hypothetical protein